MGLPYPIHVAPGLLQRIGELSLGVARAHRWAVITDANVKALYAERVVASFGGRRVEVLEIPAGEAHKTRESWARLTDALLAAGLGRDAAIVALGGGVVGDLAGFVAATYMRGIPYVQVPTTLLAMIDSSIGGKTGVDTPAGKNLVGAFHPPAAVIADVEALATLPHAQRRAGVAEAIKHGVIADARYFERIAARLPQLLDEPAGEDMRDLILRSIEIKSDVVCRDEREGGVRKILNFGHTLGHAIEAESEYRLLHGEAIAIGMVLEARLAERLGIAESGTAAEVQEAVARAGLPEHMPPSMTADRVVASTHADKKARAGAVEYALPVAIGRMAGESHGWSIPVSDDAVRELLAAGN